MEEMNDKEWLEHDIEMLNDEILELEESIDSMKYDIEELEGEILSKEYLKSRREDLLEDKKEELNRLEEESRNVEVN